MTYEIVFRKVARREFDEAADWYQSRRSGLGIDFIVEVNATLDRILQLPEAFPKVEGEIRRALVRRFPYAIHFRMDGRRIVVLSVFHGHRDPARWKHRK